MAPRSLSFFPWIAAVAGLSGCNLLTGVDDLHVRGGGGQGGATSTTTLSTTGAGGEGAGTTSGSTTTSGTTTTSGSTTTSTTSTTGMPTCTPACGAHQLCDPSTITCVCSPGFVDQGGTCAAAPPGAPSTHTQSEVCDHWADGHVLTTNSPLVASGAECDAGKLTQAAIVDTLTRINMFRWMAGLGPTSNDPALDAEAQLCANLEAWWPFTGGSPHSPPSSSKCYTPAGGAAAGKSNIAWGSGNPAQAIDQFIEDNGNETTLGHRRWILNPPLDPVGIGFWKTGGLYGNAECLEVFGSGGNGPNPSWTAMPPPGFVPSEVATWTWSFHGSLGGIANAQISMLRVDDAAPLSVKVLKLQQGFAQDAISWVPQGWQAQAGKTYRVTVSGLAAGDVTYDVKPVACN